MGSFDNIENRTIPQASLWSCFFIIIMNRNNLISIITNKSRYAETLPYVHSLKNPGLNSTTPSPSSICLFCIEQILSQSQYKALSKLYALKFLKQCFEQANPHFLHESQTQILPLLTKIIRDSVQTQNFVEYSEREYESEEELRGFKSELFSLFIFAQECMKNWALWVGKVEGRKNMWKEVKDRLEKEGIHFPIQNSYFTVKDQERFMLNYRINNNVNNTNSRIQSQQSLPNISKQPIILQVPTGKQPKYSRKLDLILLQLENNLKVNPQSIEVERREIDRLSNAFEDVMESYMTSTQKFDERFVNEYYSKLETIIKRIKQRRGGKGKMDVKEEDAYGMKMEHPPELARSLNSAFPPSSSHSNMTNNNINNQVSNNQNQGFLRQSSVISNTSRNSSIHPPIRIPSATSYPTSQILTTLAPTQQIPPHIPRPPSKASKPPTPILPSHTQQITYQLSPQPSLQQHQQAVRKNVVINENLNEVKEYQNSSRSLSNSINQRGPSQLYYQMNGSGNRPVQQNIEYSLSHQLPAVQVMKPETASFVQNQYYQTNNSGNQQYQHQQQNPVRYENNILSSRTISPSPHHQYQIHSNQQNQHPAFVPSIQHPPQLVPQPNIAPQQPNFLPLLAQQLAYGLIKPPKQQKSYTQNILAQKLIKQRRQNFQLSQNMLSLELKLQSLSKQLIQKQKDHESQRLFYRSISNSTHSPNTRPQPTLSSSRSNPYLLPVCNTPNPNFFPAHQITPPLQLLLKSLIGWTNVSKFKLSVLNANPTLFKNSIIKITCSAQQKFHKNILYLEHTVQVKTQKTYNSIQVKYSNSKEIDIWIKPYNYASEKEITQQVICSIRGSNNSTTLDTPLSLIEITIILDGQETIRTALPTLLFNFLVQGDLSSDKFKQHFNREEQFIVKSKIVTLNPTIVPNISVFYKYFNSCSGDEIGNRNGTRKGKVGLRNKQESELIWCGLLYSYSQSLLLLEIEVLKGQRAVFRVLEVGKREKSLLAKEFVDNLVFLFAA